MTFAFVYQSGERTLTDEEANAFHTGIRKALSGELKAEIRDK